MKIKRIITLMLALIMALSCFNIPSQMWSDDEGDEVFTIAPYAEGEDDPSPQSESIEINAYVDTTNWSASQRYTVEIKAPTQSINGLTGFSLQLRFNGDLFSIAPSNSAINWDLLKKHGKLENETPITLGSTTYVTFNYSLADGGLPFDVGANTTLFAFQLSVKPNVPRTDGTEITIDPVSKVFRKVNDDDATETTVNVTNKPCRVNVTGGASSKIVLSAHGETTSNGYAVGSWISAALTLDSAVDGTNTYAEYTWYRSKDNLTQAIGSSSRQYSDYTTTAADIGYYIGLQVRIAGSGYSGNDTAWLPLPITKKSAPSAPGANSIRVTSYGDTWITLEANSQLEFAVLEASLFHGSNKMTEPPPSAFKRTNVFDKLTPNTKYYIFARYAETIDTYASAVYPVYNGVDTDNPFPAQTTQTTLMTSHQIITKTSGDSVLYPSTILYYPEQQGGAIVAGSKVFLGVVVSDGYYFDHWEVTYTGGGKITVVGETATESAYFIVPPDMTNQTIITITGFFKPKASPTLTIESRTITYGTAKNTLKNEAVKYFAPVLRNGVGVAADTNTGYWDYVYASVKLYYRLYGTDDTPIPFPDFTASGAVELDAGKYQLIAVYDGDDKNYGVTYSAATLTVDQAPGITPDAVSPNDLEIGENYIRIKNTNPNQMYIVYPANSYLPDTGYSLWVRGNGDVLEWTGLLSATAYQVCTYVPSSKNYKTSAVVRTDVSTKHSWKVSVREDSATGKLCNSVYFYVQNDGDPNTKPVPGKKEVHIVNEGTGAISGIDLSIKGKDGTDDATANTIFALGSSIGTIPASKGTNPSSGYFTITPNSSGLASGMYRATLTINAQQSEASSKETASTVGDPGVIPGLPATIELILVVSEHPVVEIRGLNDKVTSYDGTQKNIDTNGVSVYSGNTRLSDVALDYTYTRLDGLYEERTDLTTSPTNAGAYLVVAQPKTLSQVELDAGGTQYDGIATATLTIARKVLKIDGLKAEDKLYDGTRDAKLTGGKLNGLVQRDLNLVWLKYVAGVTDTAMPHLPLVGTFDTKHHGTDKTVTIGTGAANENIELIGDDYLGSMYNAAANYQLNLDTLTASIQSRPITPTLPPIRKTYDGTYDIAPQRAEPRDGDVHPDDSLIIEYVGLKTETKNAGKDINIVMGTLVTTGNTFGDYIINTPVMPKAEIVPKGVFVTVLGKAEVDYDGTPKALTATYEACPGDTPNVDVTYTHTTTGVYSESAPWLAGSYTIGAIIRDPNYKDDGSTVRGITEMTIRAGKLSHTDITRSVIPGDTSIKTIPISSFNVTSGGGTTGVTGVYSIGSVIDTDGILQSGYPKVEGNVISFRVKESARLDQYAQIQVKFTPASGTFDAIDMYLKVVMALEGYTCSIVNAPTTVNIGDSIDLSKIRLRTVFDSDGHIEDSIITEAMISSGYDKSDLRASNLGLKNVVVSYPGNALRTASFNIQVVDVIDGFTVRAPDKLDYYWLVDQKLDVTGGLIMPTMRTGSAADAVSMTTGMLNVSNSTLLKTGEYNVNVTYQKITMPAAFTIKVIEPPGIDVSDPPTGDDPGVLDMEEPVEFKDSAGKPVTPNNVQLVISKLSAPDESKIQSAMSKDNFFKGLPSDSIQTLGVSLIDKTTGLDVQPTSNVTFRLNYPTGTDRSTTLRVIHVRRDNTVEVYPPTRREEGLELTVTGFSPFAIGWMSTAYVEPDPTPTPTPTPNPSTSPTPTPTKTASPTPTTSTSPTPTPTPSPFDYSGLSDSEVTFWEAVLDLIKSAEKGSVIRVNARSYDKMPVEIMEAMEKSTDLTLVVSWNGGEDIVITSKTAFKPESTREYFPLSLLADLYGTEPPKTDDPDEGEEWLKQQAASGSSSTKSGSTAGLPTVADDSKFRSAMSDYLAQAMLDANGNVYDIAAPQDNSAELQSVTSKTDGWLSPEGEAGQESGSIKPSLNAPSIASPGLGALLIIVGVILALAGGATALYIIKSKRAQEED